LLQIPKALSGSGGRDETPALKTDAAHPGVRRRPITGRHTHYQERRAALYPLLVNSRARSLPFQLPENFLLIIRAMSLTSGVCSSLDERFNLWDSVEPYAAQLLRDERGNIVQDAAQQALDAAGLALGLPKRLNGVLTRLGRHEPEVGALDARVALDDGQRGRTDLENLAPLCNADHTRSHAEGWTYERDPDGHLTVNTRHGTPIPTRPRRKPGTRAPSERAAPGALFGRT